MEGRNASPYPGLGGPPARPNPQNPNNMNPPNVSHGMGMVGPTSHPGGVPMLNMPPASRSPPPPNLINTSAPLVLNNPGGPVGQQPLPPQFQPPLPISGPGHPMQPGQQQMMGGDLGLQPQPVPHPQPQSQPQLQFTTAPPQQQQQLLPPQPGSEPPPVGYPLTRPLRTNANPPNDGGFIGQPGGPPPLMQIPSQPTSIAGGNVGAPTLVSTPVGLQQQQQQNIPINKQRVFTGVVTKMLDSFGFVDDDVFFQFDVVKGSQPKVGEKVLVEASFSPNMPFKWNANRVQVLPNQPATGSGRNEGTDPPFDSSFQQQQQQPPPPLPQQPPQFSGPPLGGGLLPPPVVAQPPIVSHQVLDHQQLQQQQIQHQQHQIQQNQQHINAGIPPPNWIPNPPAPAPLMQIETAPVIPKDPPPKEPAAAKPVHLPPRLRVGARGVLTPTTADRKRTQANLKSESRSAKSKDRESSPDSSEESSRRGGSRQKESLSRDSSPGEEEGSTDKPPGEGGPAKEGVVEERKIRTRASRQLGRPPPRYYVRIPKLSTLTQSADLVALRSRYPNLYIPSDFFVAHLACNSAFDVQHPFPLVQSNPPLSFHVLSKEDSCRLKGNNEAPSSTGGPAAETTPAPAASASIDPPDATRKYVAKVMLLSFPAFKEFCRKTIFYPGMPATADDQAEDVDEEELMHPSNCFQFLVGSKGKNEWMAVGGSWSEKEDGGNPDSDPKVLVHTAIRTTKALTGIDLSSCTRWYKFLEIHYFRPEEVTSSSTGVKVIPARTETVVMFLPDVWNWTLDEKTWETKKEAWQNSKVVVGSVGTEAAKEEEAKEEEAKPLLDPKKMKVDELRAELKRRSISDQGLKSQLIARLHKALKADLEKSAKANEASTSQRKALGLPEIAPEAKEQSEPPAEEEAEKPLPKFFEKTKILAYPNRAAKSGKFDCSVKSLHALLGYKSDDLKESTFEISLFAELFHERIMRDQGFKIFQSISSISDEKAAAQRERENEYQRHRGEPPVKKKKSESPNRASKEREDEEEEREKDEEESEAVVPKKAPKVPDAHLVFAFTYFDVNRCGYLEQKDLEDLFSILGLHLSRNQIRRILSRVTTRDYISYTKTCFLEAAGLDSEEALISHERTFWPEDKIGNRTQLNKLKGLSVYGAVKIGRNGEKVDAKSTEDGVSKSADTSRSANAASSVVNYRGQPLDLDKLFTDISKSEAGRLSFRDKLKSLENFLGATKDDESQLLKDETENNNKIECLRQEIRTTNQEIGDVKSKVAIFQDALRVQQRALETNVGEMTRIIDEEKSKKEEAAKLKAEEEAAKLTAGEAAAAKEPKPVNGAKGTA